MADTAISHAGPADGDPLTPGELDILLALPRAAKSSPDSLLFRLPKGDHPSMGYVDVSCLQACSIVSRLAATWRIRLSSVLCRDVGPGTTVCLMAQPYVHSVFHHLAFWALGCTVQFMSRLFGDDVVDEQLKHTRCRAVVYCGNDETWAKQRKERVGVEMIELPRSEYAHVLGQSEASISEEPAPEWPTPQRPSPFVIVQSSSSTSGPKTLSFSCYFYNYGLAWASDLHLNTKGPKTTKEPRIHPRLIYTPPFWQTFHRFLLSNLVTATPISLVPSPERACTSGNELAAWIETLGAGGMISAAYNVRDIILSEQHTELLQSLYTIVMIGTSVDEELSGLISQRELAATNMFGMSELGRLLTAPSPPYTHLRPSPDFPPPIALPLSVNESADGTSQQIEQPGREVELWYPVDSCPQLEHVAARGGVPLGLKPYPGPGPMHGKPALNCGDIFYETYIPNEGGSSDDKQVAYVHLGRTDDYLRLSAEDRDVNACHYEVHMRTLSESELIDSQWSVDAVQLFGANLPGTALVVQLQGEAEPDESAVQALHRAVEKVNERMELEKTARVNPSKRMLVVTRSTSEQHPPSRPTGTAISEFAHLRLSYTHKHSLRRWQNVKIFGAWLKQLDWE